MIPIGEMNIKYGTEQTFRFSFGSPNTGSLSVSFFNLSDICSVFSVYRSITSAYMMYNNDWF